MFFQRTRLSHSRIKSLFSSVLLAGLTSIACAEPWIDTSDLALRTEIQYLADKGLIKAPVTTFPLMWEAIAEDLAKVDTSQLDAPTGNAYFNVINQLDFAKKNLASVKLNISTDDNRFASFGDDFRDKNSLTLSYSAMGERWAFKLSPSYVLDPDDDDNFRLD